MSHISANDLKTKGISAIEFALSTAPEAIVSVRGKDKFVVMDMAQYHYLRECEPRWPRPALTWPQAVRCKSRPRPTWRGWIQCEPSRLAQDAVRTGIY